MSRGVVGFFKGEDVEMLWVAVFSYNADLVCWDVFEGE